MARKMRKVSVYLSPTGKLYGKVGRKKRYFKI